MTKVQHTTKPLTSHTPSTKELRDYYKMTAANWLHLSPKAEGILVVAYTLPYSVIAAAPDGLALAERILSLIDTSNGLWLLPKEETDDLRAFVAKATGN